MSEFAKYYQSAAEMLGKDTQQSVRQKPNLVSRKKVLCKFCLAEATVHEPTGRVHCRNCGSSFAITIGKSYSIDSDCLEKMSAKRLYEAAFFNGTVSLGLLERAAEKKHLKALLYLARHWEEAGNKGKAEAYYKAASEVNHEGKAAYILYCFRQEPPFSSYPNLIEELKASVGEYEVHHFYTVDPNVCDDVIAYREKCYQKHLEDERAKQERAMQKAEETPTFGYGFSDTKYPDTKPNDDGSDWRGMAWTIPGIGNGV